MKRKNAVGPKAIRRNFGLPTPLILVCLAGLVILAQGCGTVCPLQPVPQVIQDDARVAGMPDVRVYGDAPDASLHKSAVESIRQELAAPPGCSLSGTARPSPSGAGPKRA